jgi:hypothetical protein
MAQGDYVQALRDFRYDDQVGEVHTGQVFQLGGHINDDGLLRHRFLAPIEDVPTTKAKREAWLASLPTCGECGAMFLQEWQRDRCGEAHGLSAEERERQARERAHDRYERTVAPERRVMRVGA